MKLKEALGTKKFVVTSEVQAPLFDAQPEARADARHRWNRRFQAI